MLCNFLLKSLLAQFEYFSLRGIITAGPQVAQLLRSMKELLKANPLLNRMSSVRFVNQRFYIVFHKPSLKLMTKVQGVQSGAEE